MKEAEVETILQRAREQYPGEHPRIITDNGPQFVARDFKEFIRICGMTHVKTSPYYPQSNGKIERRFKTLKGECIRVNDARQDVAVLSPEQRQDRAPVQDPERRVHPRQDTPERGGRSAVGRRVRDLLQYGAPA